VPLRFDVHLHGPIHVHVQNPDVLDKLTTIEEKIMKTGDELKAGVSEAAQAVINEVKATAAAEKQQYLDVLAAVKAKSGISDEDFAAAVGSVSGISAAVKADVEGIANPDDAGTQPPANG